MEKEIIFTKGDIVTYDVAYVEQAKLEMNQPNIQARCIQQINDDGTILLDGFFDAIPSKYILPIPIESEIANQVYYNEIKSPYTYHDVYSIPPFMESLSKHPLFEQFQAANLQYVHEVQLWLEKNNTHTLLINGFYGMRKPHPVTFG
jgi:hypothetical protein